MTSNHITPSESPFQGDAVGGLRVKFPNTSRNLHIPYPEANRTVASFARSIVEGVDNVCTVFLRELLDADKNADEIKVCYGSNLCSYFYPMEDKLAAGSAGGDGEKKNGQKGGYAVHYINLFQDGRYVSPNNLCSVIDPLKVIHIDMDVIEYCEIEISTKNNDDGKVDAMGCSNNSQKADDGTRRYQVRLSPIFYIQMIISHKKRSISAERQQPKASSPLIRTSIIPLIDLPMPCNEEKDLSRNGTQNPNVEIQEQKHLTEQHNAPEYIKPKISSPLKLSEGKATNSKWNVPENK